MKAIPHTIVDVLCISCKGMPRNGEIPDCGNKHRDLEGIDAEDFVTSRTCISPSPADEMCGSKVARKGTKVPLNSQPNLDCWCSPRGCCLGLGRRKARLRRSYGGVLSGTILDTKPSKRR